MNIEKVLSQLSKPCAKRTIGKEGDLLGYLILGQIACDHGKFEEYSKSQIPLPKDKQDCNTCKFAIRNRFDIEPCYSCLPEGLPYPKWTRDK